MHAAVARGSWFPCRRTWEASHRRGRRGYEATSGEQVRARWPYRVHMQESLHADVREGERLQGSRLKVKGPRGARLLLDRAHAGEKPVG